MADIASEGIRHTRPAPAGQGRRRAAGIYGAIITAALLAAAGTKLPTDALVVSVVVTLVVYWLAEEYAELLGEQNRTGEPDLVPVRHGRMMISPFTFYRGATTIMAADLAGTPVAGLGAQLCGDAHLSNFGAFASPERTLVFDVNDFDGTLPGPFEYDVKRMAASFATAARNNGFAEPDARAVTLASVASYAWTCGGHWPARTPSPGTPSSSQPGRATATSSTQRSPNCHTATPTRTSATIRRSSRRSEPVGYQRSRASKDRKGGNPMPEHAANHREANIDSDQPRQALEPEPAPAAAQPDEHTAPTAMPGPPQALAAPPVPAAERVRAAARRRDETDYIFQYWSALGWTILTLGIYGYYVFYQLIRRMRDHNARRLELLDAATAVAWEQAGRRGLQQELGPSFERAAGHLAELRRMTGDFREPVIWLLLAILARGIAEIVGFVLLDQDLVKHGRAEAGAGHELSVIYGRLGHQVPSLDQGQVKNPDNYAGRILAAIFTLGIYMFWWFYNQMDEPNKHFTSNWAQEDELVTAVDAIG